MTDKTKTQPDESPVKGASDLKCALMVLAGFTVAAIAARLLTGTLLFGFGGAEVLMLLFILVSVMVAVVAVIGNLVEWGWRMKFSTLSGAVMVLAICAPVLPSLFGVTRVVGTLDSAEYRMGAPIPVAKTVESRMGNWKEFRKNKEFLSNFGHGSSTRRDEVFDFIEHASRMGVNVDFTATNGIVRASDKQVLYRKTLAAAASGDGYAIALLKEQGKTL